MPRRKQPKLAVIYVRVSTERQGKSGVGAEAQEAACRTYAKHLGYEVLGVFQETASAMGQDSIKKRPQLSQAFSVAESEGAIVICYEFSRISRNTDTAVKLVRNAKVAVYEACTGDKMKGLVLKVAAERAEVVGKAIGASVKRSLAEKKAAGVLLGNRTNLSAAQKSGAATNADRGRRTVKAISDVLSRHPESVDMNASEIVALLNSSGCLSGSMKPWTVAAVRRPLKAARTLLEEDADGKMRNDPLFGMF